jgi:CheY-like chemotaxis protein
MRYVATKDNKEKISMLNILIVDDQPHVREFLSEELAYGGYQVGSVGDSESLWEYLRVSPPDLVLLDLYLDGFEGLEILHDIKRKDPNLPVLILTAYDSFRGDPRLSQADGYVIKSFIALDELKQKIAEVLNGKQIPKPGM